MEFFQVILTKKNRILIIWSLLLFIFTGKINAQDEVSKSHDSLTFKGQLSAWEHYNPINVLPFWSGVRYIPQLNYEIKPAENRLIDFETSANIYGNAGLKPFDTTSINGDIKPYRMWARYSTRQFEFRAGLQKINFGSATLLRPLMWFDQIDPRDPLQLTDGVWGALARYYFLNNANAWLWVLYGNKNPKGWEIIKTSKNIPEVGGRFQTPVPKGEAAISYHHRSADSSDLSFPDYQYANIPENRIGFDVKFDLAIGCWLEASWINRSKDIGNITNQEILNLGADYTFNVGNGLNIIFEQLLAANDEKAFEFDQTISFSLLNMNYPIGLFDNINVIIYYDWKNNATYNFINWQKQFNKISLYFMGYINPKNYIIPMQGATEKLYAGSGVQVMFVYNH
jgi:hypothetical protein